MMVDQVATHDQGQAVGWMMLFFEKTWLLWWAIAVVAVIRSSFSSSVNK